MKLFFFVYRYYNIEQCLLQYNKYSFIILSIYPIFKYSFRIKFYLSWCREKRYTCTYMYIMHTVFKDILCIASHLLFVYIVYYLLLMKNRYFNVAHLSYNLLISLFYKKYFMIINCYYNLPKLH